MRNYCRFFHTSLDYLTEMPMGRLMVELQDAFDDLIEEQARREREQKARIRSGSQARHRRR